jgi:DNA repair ATPase RecN
MIDPIAESICRISSKDLDRVSSLIIHEYNDSITNRSKLFKNWNNNGKITLIEVLRLVLADRSQVIKRSEKYSSIECQLSSSTDKLDQMSSQFKSTNNQHKNIKQDISRVDKQLSEQSIYNCASTIKIDTIPIKCDNCDELREQIKQIQTSLKLMSKTVSSLTNQLVAIHSLLSPEQFAAAPVDLVSVLYKLHSIVMLQYSNYILYHI